MNIRTAFFSARLSLVLVSAMSCQAVKAGSEAAAGGNPASAKPPSGWQQWHGLNRDGKSLETGLLKSWPPEGPKLLWKNPDVGFGWSSVSVGGGLAYTTGLMPDNHLHMTALDMQGKITWSKDVGAAFTNSYKGARSTPTYENGDLFLLGCLGVLGCYDAKTGDTKWQRDIRKDFQSHPTKWMFAESALLVDNMVIATPGGTNAFMVALNRNDGTTVWESGPFGPACYSSPIYAVYEGVPMIINGAANGITGIHAKTGKLLWTNDFAAGNVANCPTPICEDGRVFWAVGYGRGGICLKLSVSGENVTATELWRTQDVDPQYGGYVLHDGYLYGSVGYEWTCLDFKTGKTLWKADGVRKGAISYADGMLYLYGIDKGHTILAPASPKGLEPAGEFRLYDRKSPPGRAHPAIADGRLYLRCDMGVYCFDLRQGQPAK